jgi:hypothetical protein
MNHYLWIIAIVQTNIKAFIEKRETIKPSLPEI